MSRVASASSATTTTDGTLPGPDAGKVVTRFAATFEGDLQPGAQAVVPFVVNASPEILAESTATNVATAQAADGDAQGETATATDEIDLLPERVATEFSKEILRPELWGVGGVATGVKFDAKVSEQPASTIGADSLVITDPVGTGSTFWNYARVTGVTTAEIPANADLVVRYLDANGVWQELGTYPGPQIVKDLAVPTTPAPGAQGIQLDYRAKPGKILEPGFHVRPVVATELLSTGRDGVPLADLGAAGARQVRQEGVEIAAGARERVVRPGLGGRPRHVHAALARAQPQAADDAPAAVVAGLTPVGHAEQLQLPDRLRGEAVAADLVAGEGRLLEEDDVPAGLGEPGGGGGPSGPGADDDEPPF